jgi:hypothetical protein
MQYYYLVTFSVNIDMKHTTFGKLGTSLDRKDEFAAVSSVKQAAEKRCRAAYPKAKTIIITIMNVEEVDSLNSLNAGQSFRL